MPPARDWQPRVNEARTWIRDQDAPFEMNEPDAYALEEGLRLKERHGGEVVVCSAGPARVSQVIREALARGADRAIHVESDELAGADAFAGTHSDAGPGAHAKPDAGPHPGRPRPLRHDGQRHLGRGEHR